jgi:AGZA family xanthine/uracil permease-like MFS transporter
MDGRLMLERRFGLAEHGTDVRTETIAGATTFLTMVYIAFVNPQMLAEAGMDQGAVFVATCTAAMIGTLIMGLYANYPIALAPGMGLNAYFAYTVVLTLGYSWQTALAAVFISGVLFLCLSLVRVREVLINSVPRTLKLAISAGIGLFLGLIALQNAGLVTAHPIAWRRVPGSVLLGILAATIAGLPLGLTSFQGIVSAPPDPTPTLLALDFAATLQVGFVTIVFTFLFVDLFDTAGTLIGVAHRANLLDEHGRLPRLNRALLADSSATVVGSMLGTSTVTSYIESATGTNVGGRTGLTAVVVAGLFGLTLFFAPLAAMIPAYATSSALLFVAALLLFVAALMARGLAEIEWDDVTEYAPAVITAIGMPLTFSIATGIGFGFISYAAIKLLSGRWREIGPAVLVIALLFIVKFAIT